ncbi:MAG: DUF3604 domain-containing protein [Candidatus Neomarinimicrobiota bacterium]
MNCPKWLLPALLMFSLNVVFCGEPTPICSIGELGGTDLRITSHPFAEYPDLSQDKTGDIFIVYSELIDGKERIMLKIIHDFVVIDSLQISESAGIEGFPRIVSCPSGIVWIVWAGKRDGNWDLFTRRLSSGNLSPEIRLTNDSTVDLHPAIISDLQNNIWIAWERVEDGNFNIYGMKMSDSQPGKPFPITDTEDKEFRPTLVFDAKNVVYAAWDCQKAENYEIFLRKFVAGKWQTAKSVSPEASGKNMAPSLTIDSKGKLTVAWHSNLLASGGLDYNPWIFMKSFNSDGSARFFTPANDGDRQKLGEDQGFEFPNILIDRQGKLWLFGRPSQNFFVQCVQSGNVSPIYRFDIEGWGGRGQDVRAIVGQDGKIYSVRRDLQAIYLNRFDPASKNLSFVQETTPISAKPPIQMAEKVEIPAGFTLPDGYQIYFGDIHQHSALSDGMGTPDECYARSRFDMRHDFAALTDHEWFTQNYILPSEWEWIKIVGQSFSEDSVFTTIPAYEWTTGRTPKGFGHKNVYFSSWNKPIFSCRFDATNTTDLVALLKQNQAIAIPHHIGWIGTDWEAMDSVVIPVSEIASTHGVFEYMGNEPIAHRGGIPGSFIQDGLARGNRFGFVGGTDGHGLKWHHGVGTKYSEWASGLTGVIAKENSREAILDAIKHRRVYATTGARIQMNFQINGRLMGESIVSTGDPEIQIDVLGTAKIHYVVLLRDNQPILTIGKDFDEGCGVRRTFVDETVTAGEHFYYLRVIQEDNEMAWSSPVWVEVRK